ncbi:hypothetical protein NQ315_016721 [Exocentrus adspersus]|uniref:Double jelly roll-like domain-containing protein n=1 Tax=Exocentrus adspersus TaxID=1586481 RepID=A0AAV8VER8_9CUCU|nr:hypothetical protein NQ315_016721 [Exocentrus adspersus]
MALTLASSIEKCDVFDEPIFDNSIVSLHEHTYKPYGSPSYKNSDEIRIPVHFQDLILDISESYIYIEGKFTPSQFAADGHIKCNLSNNALAFLFEEIRYEMGGEQIAVVRKPGITTSMKTMLSFGASQLPVLLTYGWGLGEDHQDILDDTTHVFSGRLPLKYLMGFAEDYTKGLINVKQELILILARTFKNCYVGDVEANIVIDKIEWKIRHVVPEDRLKLKLMSRINKSSTSPAGRIKVPYRMWDLYELPKLRETSSDIWAIKTSTSLERPRYVIIGFQSIDNCDNTEKDASVFMNADVSDIRLYLNSDVYPYERWNMDFTKKLSAPAYYAYINFQRTYYGKEMSEPMLNFTQFLQTPLFVIDCSHQSEAVKSSTVDIKLEFETRKSTFPSNVKVYALILHDSLIKYSALEGTVYLR